MEEEYEYCDIIKIMGNNYKPPYYNWSKVFIQVREELCEYQSPPQGDFGGAWFERNMYFIVYHDGNR